jgi:hypothetical protein
VKQISRNILTGRDERMVLILQCLIEEILPFSHVIALEKLRSGGAFH